MECKNILLAGVDSSPLPPLLVHLNEILLQVEMRECFEEARRHLAVCYLAVASFLQLSLGRCHLPSDSCYLPVGNYEQHLVATSLALAGVRYHLPFAFCYSPLDRYQLPVAGLVMY